MKGIARRNAVAGAGTESVPCAHSIVPEPTFTGEATTSSGARAFIRWQNAAMSATASRAPTSWKWTSPTGRPCARDSAAAIAS